MSFARRWGSCYGLRPSKPPQRNTPSYEGGQPLRKPIHLSTPGPASDRSPPRLKIQSARWLKIPSARTLGIFHLAHGFVKALHGDIDGQTFAQGCETVGDLLGLLKPALKMLTPVQIAVMAVAHDLGVQAEPWEVWLDQVNEYLTHWRQAQVPMVTLRKEIEDLRKRGFTVHDSGQDLRIPTTMVVVSVKRIREAAQRLRRR